MSSLFDVIAADENDSRLAFRKAAAVTQARVENVYGAWIRQDPARLSFVEDEIRAIAAQAGEEFGVKDSTTIADVVLGAGWEKDADCGKDHDKKDDDNGEDEPKSDKLPWNKDEDDDSDKDDDKKESSVRESRKPKMCPFHKDVVDISLNAGDPTAGYTAMAQHWGGDRHCEGGGYEGSKCNFKPQMTTQAFWDQKAEKAEEKRQQRLEQQEQEAVANPATDQDGDPIFDPTLEEHLVDEGIVPETEGAEVIEFPSSEPTAVGEGVDAAPEPLAVAASTKTADDGLGGKGTPSPKIDKRLWTPKTVPALKGLDESSPNPSERIDPTEAIEYEKSNKSELKNIDGGNTKRESLPSSDNAGFSSGGEDFGPHTDTFGNKGQADPVTAAAEDPEKNPIVEHFLSEDEITKVISDYKG
jgi:hypothetical protein